MEGNKKTQKGKIFSKTHKEKTSKSQTSHGSSNRSKKGKLSIYFDNDTDILNYYEYEFEDLEREEKKKKPHSYKKEETDENRRYLKGKLHRMYFLNIPIEMRENKEKKSAASQENEENSKAKASEEEYKPKRYRYIQMKLDVNKITPKFEEELESYKLKGISYREAKLTDEDLQTITRLYNRAFMMGKDPWSPATPEQFRKILSIPTTVILIASIGEEDVGFIILDHEGENGEIGVICGLGTDPRWRRRGIARFLGVIAWDYFRKKNVKELHCEVYEKNEPSYKLIKSLHFEEYGEKFYEF